MLSKDFLIELLGFVDEMLLEKLCEIAELTELKRGQQIVRQGDIPQQAYFLISGVFRAFYINAKCVEVTDFFAYRHGSLLVSSYDLISPAPVTKYLWNNF